MQETRIWSLGQEDPLEKGTASHCSILAWKTPWTEEPGRLQSMESQSQAQLSNEHFHSESWICSLKWMRTIISWNTEKEKEVESHNNIIFYFAQDCKMV